jgi:hypothetical protein
MLARVIFGDYFVHVFRRKCLISIVKMAFFTQKQAVAMLFQIGSL